MYKSLRRAAFAIGISEWVRRAVQEKLERDAAAAGETSLDLRPKRAPLPRRYPGHRPGTDAWIPVFLAELASSGNVKEAARHAKVSREYVYQRRAVDEDFAKRMQQAREGARLTRWRAAKRPMPEAGPAKSEQPHKGRTLADLLAEERAAKGGPPPAPQPVAQPARPRPVPAWRREPAPPSDEQK